MNNYEKPSTRKIKLLVRLHDNYVSEMLHRNDNKLI